MNNRFLQIPETCSRSRDTANPTAGIDQGACLTPVLFLDSHFCIVSEFWKIVGGKSVIVDIDCYNSVEVARLSHSRWCKGRLRHRA